MEIATPLEDRVLTYIRSHRLKQFGNSPSIREIAGALGHRSPFAVQRAISGLVSKKMLKKVGALAHLVPQEEIVIPTKK